MIQPGVYTLVNSQNGNLAFKYLSFDDNSYFDHLQRNNYYSLIYIKEGNGTAKSDFSTYTLREGSLFAFSPYQPFMFSSVEDFKGVAIQFHPDFFCIHKHQEEVACNGILFNNIYQAPFILIDNKHGLQLDSIIEQIRLEMENVTLGQYDLLLSYLKILLILLSRIKLDQDSGPRAPFLKMTPPFILQNLKKAIDTNYRVKHSAADYADLLNISVKALAKITKTHFNKTLTHLIAERIIIEAKRELYLTSKSVKEIAYELGYSDEYYFSRFFKTNTDVSPQMYRETVGFAAAAG